MYDDQSMTSEAPVVAGSSSGKKDPNLDTGDFTKFWKIESGVTKHTSASPWVNYCRLQQLM